MAPEKRPAEEESEQEAKRPKEDSESTATVQDAVLDESSQDSVASTSSTNDATKQRLPVPANKGTVIFCGCAQWEYVGRRNLKPNPTMLHYAPRILKSLLSTKIAYVTSHCSAMHSVLITTEGKVMTLGRNEKGQLGVGDSENRASPVTVDSMKEFTVVQAAVGRNHTLFLTDRGTVFACGDNKSGQCGLGNTNPVVPTPCRISFKEAKIIKVACGGEFSMIVDKKGYMYSFGLPEYGQLGHNTDGKFFVTSNKLTFQCETSPKRIAIFVERSKGGHPTPVPDVQIVDVACGNNHTVCVDARKRVYSFGFGGYGRLGHAEQKDEMIPRMIKFFEGVNRGVSKVFCGSAFTMCLSDMGVFLWGQTKRTGEANMYPKPVQDLFGWNVKSIGCSATSIVVSADNSVIAWGPSPTYGELGLGENVKSSSTAKELKLMDGLDVSQVTCAAGFTLMLAKDDEESDQEILKKLKVIDM